MRLLIDTDPAIGTSSSDPEDGLAILYALGTPDVTVEGITLVQGNVPISHSWQNARHLLDLAGRPDVPLHVGAHEPRSPGRRPLQCAWLAQRAGMPSAVPPLAPPGGDAAAFIAETVLGAPGEITLVAIGPLTNVAAALDADASVAGALGGLVIMGGTVATRGNITPAAEFNLWMDPDAAHVVFESGAPITMVGLDVCHRTRFGRVEAASLRGTGSPLATLVADAADSWISVRELLGDEADDLHLYDSLAMAAAVEPDLLTCRPAMVQVETGEGPAQGMTVCHTDDLLRQLLTGRDHNASVAVDVDVARFEARFAERVTARL